MYKLFLTIGIALAGTQYERSGRRPTLSKPRQRYLIKTSSKNPSKAADVTDLKREGREDEGRL